MELKTGSVEERISRLELASGRHEHALKGVRKELGEKTITDLVLFVTLMIASFTNIVAVLVVTLR